MPIFYLPPTAEAVWCPTGKIGAAKRAHYRKYGSATLAFGMSALSLRASSRDKSTSSALSGTHGALAGALHYSSCGTKPAASIIDKIEWMKGIDFRDMP
jgi:hypothetical protein